MAIGLKLVRIIGGVASAVFVFTEFGLVAVGLVAVALLLANILWLRAHPR